MPNQRQFNEYLRNNNINNSQRPSTKSDARFLFHSSAGIRVHRLRMPSTICSANEIMRMPSSICSSNENAICCSADESQMVLFNKRCQSHLSFSFLQQKPHRGCIFLPRSNLGIASGLRQTFLQLRHFGWKAAIRRRPSLPRHAKPHASSGKSWEGFGEYIGEWVAFGSTLERRAFLIVVFCHRSRCRRCCC